MDKKAYIRHDGWLNVEAYRFLATAQSFPNHFHDYYVIGAMEAGHRRLFCKNREYAVCPGDILLFNPGDSHACTQEDGGLLAYRGLNIPRETLQPLSEEVSGRMCPVLFSKCVMQNEALYRQMHALHSLLMEQGQEFEKEEGLLLFLSCLILQVNQQKGEPSVLCREEVRQACALMEECFAQPVTLEMLCRHCHLSKSTLLRAFVKEKGMTPYRYLQALRIGRAKALLERGCRRPDMNGEEVYDREGQAYEGTVRFPVPVLSADAERLREILVQLQRPEYAEVLSAGFSSLAQGCRNYEEYAEKMAQTSGAQLQYLGIALCGDKKRINRLTGSLPLLR